MPNFQIERIDGYDAGHVVERKKLSILVPARMTAEEVDRLVDEFASVLESNTEVFEDGVALERAEPQQTPDGQPAPAPTTLATDERIQAVADANRAVAAVPEPPAQKKPGPSATKVGK